jgi:tRNA-binding protein
MKEQVSPDDFFKLDIRIGTILSAEPFQEARHPAYILQIEFGMEIGILKSSAQITDRYQPEELTGKQVVAVVNFPPKQIANMQSQCLVLGAVEEDSGVILLGLTQSVPNGTPIA